LHFRVESKLENELPKGVNLNDTECEEEKQAKKSYKNLFRFCDVIAQD